MPKSWIEEIVISLYEKGDKTEFNKYKGIIIGI